nr:neurotoxin type B Hn+ 21.5 kda subunit [Clostridium botulinum, type B, Peptide Partial, 10 aa] [Clostridium botulinum]AAB21359.1 neurotoxin type A Hn+ 21.5 kda subunit [Clostridium botulinum, type A, Peptide Partial, 10 aa] [Clostridium botulinum]
VINYSDTIDL